MPENASPDAVFRRRRTGGIQSSRGMMALLFVAVGMRGSSVFSETGRASTFTLNCYPSRETVSRAGPSLKALTSASIVLTL